MTGSQYSRRKNAYKSTGSYGVILKKISGQMTIHKEHAVKQIGDAIGASDTRPGLGLEVKQQNSTGS